MGSHPECHCSNCGATYPYNRRRKTTLCRDCLKESPEVRQRLSEGLKRAWSEGKKKPLPYTDFTGMVFGQLTALRTKGLNKHGQRTWECVCSCGRKTTVLATGLSTGYNTRCQHCGWESGSSKLRKYEGTPAERGRARTLSILYNLTPEDYKAILEFQGGVCPITLKASRRFVVDHDHKDGMVRGILDWRVNRSLAMFNDDPAMLRRAADYLERPPAAQALSETVYGVIGKISRKAKNRRYGPDGTKEPQQRKAKTQ